MALLSHSDLFVTVNTHVSTPTQAFADSLERACYELGTLVVAANVFSSIELHEARVYAGEVGLQFSSRQGQLHAHFKLDLTHAHSTPLSLGPAQDPDGRGINERLQDYFNEAIPWRGCYVRAQIDKPGSATKNYNRKQQLLLAGDSEGRLLPDVTPIDRA